MRHVMDHTVGLNAAVAVMAALQRRRMTGQGGLVDGAARGVASSLLGEALLVAAAGGEPTRAGNDHQRMAPHGIYPAGGEDRWLAIGVRTDAEWRALVTAIGEPGLAEDSRFAGAEARHANRAALDPIVGAWTATLPAQEAAERLQAAGIAAHASWTTAEIAADPHLWEFRVIVTVPEPDGKERHTAGEPKRLSNVEQSGIHRGTPKL